jgi:hypothetical protein
VTEWSVALLLPASQSAAARKFARAHLPFPSSRNNALGSPRAASSWSASARCAGPASQTTRAATAPCWGALGATTGTCPGAATTFPGRRCLWPWAQAARPRRFQARPQAANRGLSRGAGCRGVSRIAKKGPPASPESAPGAAPRPVLKPTMNSARGRAPACPNSRRQRQVRPLRLDGLRHRPAPSHAVQAAPSRRADSAARGQERKFPAAQRLPLLELSDVAAGGRDCGSWPRPRSAHKAASTLFTILPARRPLHTGCAPATGSPLPSTLQAAQGRSCATAVGGPALPYHRSARMGFRPDAAAYCCPPAGAARGAPGCPLSSFVAGCSSGPPALAFVVPPLPCHPVLRAPSLCSVPARCSKLPPF